VTRDIKHTQATAHCDIDALIKFLDKLPNVRIAILEGIYSEPTLYKHFKEVVQYFKSRNITIRLTTNGNTYKEPWWESIGPLFRKEDIIRFAIDGSTQELYERYRVGGNLEKVLAHHRAFKSNSEGTTVLQNILFQHNEHDTDNIKAMFIREGFDYIGQQKCYQSSLLSADGFAPTKEPYEYYLRYQRMLDGKSIAAPTVHCDSHKRGEIYINHDGQIFICGVHDEAKPYPNIPTIHDDIDTIMQWLSMIVSNTATCGACQNSCNVFCYSYSKKFPDLVWDKDLNEYPVQYYTLNPFDGTTSWNLDKLI
jgi:MoaA/NifB/PqqE/SkfB family radical SAM enzyme